MRAKLKNLRQSDGFTIIEVLIVLAIAGLIMLIVFLAVPSLQRNSRNTQRRNDVSAVLAAVADYQNNDGGRMIDAQADVDTVKNNVKLGFYQAAGVYYGGAAGAAVTVPTTIGNGTSNAAVSTENIFIYTGKKCTSQAAAPTATGATARNLVAVFAVETANGGTFQCIES
jgi:prepilin-type N-terminal cleavage/methylation domain-containing protein